MRCYYREAPQESWVDSWGAMLLWVWRGSEDAPGGTEDCGGSEEVGDAEIPGAVACAVVREQLCLEGVGDAEVVAGCHLPTLQDLCSETELETEVASGIV